MRFLLILFCLFYTTASYAVDGTDSQVGDDCSSLSAGATRFNASATEVDGDVLLICDGSVWQTANAPDTNLWYEDGSDIYFNTGNVGFGSVTNPAADFHLQGDGILDVNRGIVYLENNANDNADGAGITLRTASNPTTNGGSIFSVRSTSGGLRLWVGQGILSTGRNKFYVGTDDDGKSNPAITMDTAGTINAAELCDETGANCTDLSAGSSDSDTLSDLSCSDGQTATWDNGNTQWVCTDLPSGSISPTEVYSGTINRFGTVLSIPGISSSKNYMVYTYAYPNGSDRCWVQLNINGAYRAITDGVFKTKSFAYLYVTDTSTLLDVSNSIDNEALVSGGGVYTGFWNGQARVQLSSNCSVNPEIKVFEF